MSKSTYIFCCCILLISNQSFAVNWCSSDALESVLQCLSKGQFVQFTGWLELTRRISCSEIGLCKPKPWNIFSSKIRVVRKYAKCMKDKIVGLEESLLYDSHIESKCRNYLNENLPDSLKHHNLHLLPDLNPNSVPIMIQRRYPSFTINWCPSNALESVVQCLTKDKFIPYMDPFEIHSFKVISVLTRHPVLNQRIGCSKIGICKPKPWDIFKSKIRIARKYAKCMKNNIVGLVESLLYDSHIESTCRSYLNENLPDSLKHYDLHLLPDLHKE